MVEGPPPAEGDVVLDDRPAGTGGGSIVGFRRGDGTRVSDVCEEFDAVSDDRMHLTAVAGSGLEFAPLEPAVYGDEAAL